MKKKLENFLKLYERIIGVEAGEISERYYGDNMSDENDDWPEEEPDFDQSAEFGTDTETEGEKEINDFDTSDKEDSVKIPLDLWGYRNEVKRAADLVLYHLVEASSIPETNFFSPKYDFSLSKIATTREQLKEMQSRIHAALDDEVLSYSDSMGQYLTNGKLSEEGDADMFDFEETFLGVMLSWQETIDNIIRAVRAGD